MYRLKIPDLNYEYGSHNLQSLNGVPLKRHQKNIIPKILSMAMKKFTVFFQITSYNPFLKSRKVFYPNLKISITTELIGFSVLGRLLIVHVMVFD